MGSHHEQALDAIAAARGATDALSAALDERQSKPWGPDPIGVYREAIVHQLQLAQVHATLALAETLDRVHGVSGR